MRRSKSYRRRATNWRRPAVWSKPPATRWCEARLDQRDLGALRAAAEQARATFGRLDILFANAGIQAFKPILEWDDADWHDTIDVNLTGTCNAIRAVAPHLVKNGGGRIIVTSSTQGRHGTKYGAAYSASKWGIIGLMKSAALELGEYQITVNAVIPGLIDTPLTRHRRSLCAGRRRFRIQTTDGRAGSRSQEKADRKIAAWHSLDRARGGCAGRRVPCFRRRPHGERCGLRRHRRRQRQLHGLAIPSRRANEERERTARRRPTAAFAATASSEACPRFPVNRRTKLHAGAD